MTPKTLNYRQAAEYLGLSRHTIRNHMHQGTGPKATLIRGRTGPEYAFTIEDLDSWQCGRDFKSALIKSLQEQVRELTAKIEVMTKKNGEIK